MSSRRSVFIGSAIVLVICVSVIVSQRMSEIRGLSYERRRHGALELVEHDYQEENPQPHVKGSSLRRRRPSSRRRGKTQIPDPASVVKVLQSYRRGWNVNRSLRYVGTFPVYRSYGLVWPKPQNFLTWDTYMILSSEFTITSRNSSCEILDEAIRRYYKVVVDLNKMTAKNLARKYENLFRYEASRNSVRGETEQVSDSQPLLKKPSESLSKDPFFGGYLNNLDVYVTADCEEWPYYGMDEQYSLRVNFDDSPKTAKLIAPTVWGALRGLETFSQIVVLDPFTGLIRLNSTFVVDFPRYSHRGVLIDTSRHYLPKKTIYKILDGMEANKLNVFHWHIVDDHSFPFVSQEYPELSAMGAYNPYTHVYTFRDVQDIVQYARLRGIRVVPELDTPGHVDSWGLSHPEILTKCYGTQTQRLETSQNVDRRWFWFIPVGSVNSADAPSNWDGTYGPLNPTLNETYKIVGTLLREFVDLFPDEFVHFGGDEVPLECWQSNPEIQKFVASKNWTDFRLLEGYYLDQVNSLLKEADKNKTRILWQEAFDNGNTAGTGDVIQVWKQGAYELEVAAVTAKGNPAILSSCWYLDHVKKAHDWYDFYQCEPSAFPGSANQKRLLLGGEACLWGEFVDATNVVSRLFPRVSAVAEKLWSPAENSSSSRSYRGIPADLASRLEEHRCRMIGRGIGAEPQLGPGFCDVEYGS